MAAAAAAAEEEAKAAAKQDKKNKKKKEKKISKVVAAAAAAGPEHEMLDPIAIKKMKPPVLKEKLKERDLPCDGPKKDLVARLLKFNEEAMLDADI